jgi:hypothetical protein
MATVALSLIGRPPAPVAPSATALTLIPRTAGLLGLGRKGRASWVDGVASDVAIALHDTGSRH